MLRRRLTVLSPSCTPFNLPLVSVIRSLLIFVLWESRL